MESGENKTETVKYAGFSARVVAFVIDILILLLPALFLLIGIPFATALLTDKLTVSIISSSTLLGTLFLHPLYGALFESSKLQATPGKLICKIKVTDISGNRCSFARSFVRNLAFLVSQLSFNIGYLMLFWTKKKQCLHDIMANCLVLRA